MMLNDRLSASEEYLKQLVSSSLDEYAKGEWVGAVRMKFRELSSSSADAML